MKNLEKVCVLCGNSAGTMKMDHGHRLDISCPNCGRYQITVHAVRNLTDTRREFIKVLIKTPEQKLGYYDISLNAEKQLCHAWITRK